jgi:hypothetical protein
MSGANITDTPDMDTLDTSDIDLETFADSALDKSITIQETVERRNLSLK